MKSESVVARPNETLTTAELARAAERSEDRSRTSERRPDGPAPMALFENDETSQLRKRWTDIQGSFVDEPRRAVKEADGLVADVMKRLAETFSKERSELERQWDRGDDVTTEDLRLALQRYHTFFDRLLAV